MIITAYNQITSDVSISSSTVNLGYPLDNLLDQYGSQVFKFNGFSDENIVIDAGSGNTIDLDSIGITNHNITSGATITLEGNAADSWGAPTYSEPLTWYATTIYEMVATFSYRYMRIRFQNSTTNPIEIGYISVGTKITAPNANAQIAFTTINAGGGEITGSGQSDGTPKYTARERRLTFTGLTNTERNTLQTLIETNGTYTNMFLAIWENSYTYELPMYCKITEYGDFVFNGYGFDISITFREVL